MIGVCAGLPLCLPKCVHPGSCIPRREFLIIFRINLFANLFFCAKSILTIFIKLL